MEADISRLEKKFIYIHLKLIETFQLAKYKFENLCIRIRKINQNIQVLQ